MNKKKVLTMLTVISLLAGTFSTSPLISADEYADDDANTVAVSADAVDTSDSERLNYIALSAELSIQDMLSTIYDGTWVETGYGFDLYFPKGWLFADLTDEQTAAGEVFDLADETSTHHVTLSVSSADDQNGATLESLYSTLSAEADRGLLTDCMIKTVNGIYCITCTRISGEDIDTPATEVNFYDAAGNLFTLRIGPVDDSFRSAAANILCSLSMTEVHTESDAAQPTPEG